MRYLITIFMIFGLSISLPAATQTAQKVTFTIDELASGLDVPWGMAFISETQLIVTQKDGGALLLDINSSEIIRLQGTPKVKGSGQGGFLDVAVPPDYPQSAWIYFTYSKPVDKSGVTTLARAKLKQDSLVGWQDILISRSASDTSRHYGSRIAFDEENHIYFTIGDRGVRPNGQDLTSHAGSVIRLNLDGSTPTDNPFQKTENALPEIYSYGHRNPQGIAYDYELQRLWIIEHGPRGGDEINLIYAGANYGWPEVSHGQEYWAPIAVGEATSRKDVEPPVKVYIPSIAPASLLLYSGKAFPEWQGNLFAGALKLRHLNRIVLNSEGKAEAEERLLSSLEERIRALVEGPDGNIYFSTDSGRIMRLRP